MKELKYYFSVLLRRSPLFLIVACGIAAVSIFVSRSLPPEYVSSMRLIVEGPRIPTELANSLNETSELEQLQIIEQKLLTRNNLLDIASRYDFLPNLDELTPDEIYAEMRSRTRFIKRARRNEAAVLNVQFTARDAKSTSDILNEYLTIIRQLDVEESQGKSADTVRFFEQDVARLRRDLDVLNERILEFKLANTNSLPENISIRISQLTVLQERLVQTDREISDAEQQRQRAETIFTSTGETGQPADAVVLTADEIRLNELQSQLTDALAIFSESNPNVVRLRQRIENLETAISDQIKVVDEDDQEGDGPTRAEILFKLQMDSLEKNIANLRSERERIENQIREINALIEKAPATGLELQNLELERVNLENEYGSVQESLARARTNDTILSSSRGQKITLVDAPTIPDKPSKPNRTIIAAGGSFLGLLAGLALVALLEIFDSSVRRPEDLVRNLGIIPIATVPYTRTRRELFLQRGFKLFVLLGILVVVPAVVYAVHVYYLPLDIVVAKVLRKLGI